MENRGRLIMTKYRILYQSKETISAREKGLGEWTEYDAVITIKSGGKNPITIEMTFNSTPRFAIELPKTHTIRAENLTQAYVKVVKFLIRYGFEFK